MPNRFTPGEAMYKAIQKIDISPVVKEIHAHPFLWVIISIVLFFAIGSLFEILWMILRDVRRFAFRIFRLPKLFIRNKFRPVRKGLRKKYGDKAKEDKGYFKK